MQKLGYTYLSQEQEEALELRGCKTTNVLLESVLRKQLSEINSEIQVSGTKTAYFSAQNIENGVVALRSIAKAPYAANVEVIRAKVHKRAAWILKQQNYFKSFGERTPERKYISGESHLYLGRQYLLRVTEGMPDSVKYKGRYFEIVCSSKENAKEVIYSSNLQ